jgi:hypothetical protein
MTDPANLAFLPWVRQGAASGLDVADARSPDQAAAATLDLILHLNDEPDLPTSLALRGPADVLGLDPNQVIRLEPRAGASDFEPNFFAAIEFDRADLPWLFTPLKAGDQARLRPWLCLAVVARGDGVVLDPAGEQPLPQLRIGAPAIAAHELPDPTEAWAWAHAQAASGDTSEAAVQGALAGPPERSLARLICPRRLEPNTDYLACVVPVFELGRRAGLGLPVALLDLTGPGALAPAWDLTAQPPHPVVLPVYFSWSFRTGAAGDFEALAKRLTPQPAPPRLGLRAADFGTPGFPLQGAPAPPIVMDVGGALEPVDAPEISPPWPAGVQAPFQTGLANIVNTAGEIQAAHPDADPILAPPLYGRWPAARTTAQPAAAPWFDELNLDPRWRSIAAYGVQVVQAHQEALMASAWAQAGDLREANQRIRQLQLSLAAGVRLHVRHFQTLDPDVGLRVTAPAFGRLRAPVTSGSAPQTLYARLSQAPAATGATSAAMRQIGRARGPVTRRAASQSIARTPSRSWVTLLNGGLAVLPAAPVSGFATIGAIRAQMGGASNIQGYAQVTADVVAAAGPQPSFSVVPEGQPVQVGPPPPHGGGHGPVHWPPHGASDSATAKAFRQAATAHLARLDPGRPMIIVDPVPPLNLSDLHTIVLQGLDPRVTLMSLAKAVIAVGHAASAPVDSSSSATPALDTLQMVPRFPQPMYEPLRDISQELLLPGLEAVVADTVLGLKTNRRFVEAYMGGLNGEMGAELLWRGFPTDQRGTYFDQFWDVSAAAAPVPDIAPLTAWADHPLGASPAVGQDQQPERFVLLVRSTLLQRYPNAIIYAVRAVRTAAGREISSDPSDDVLPAFTGGLPPDVSFFGFPLSGDAVTGDDGSEGYYLVIQEHPTEPRFGLAADAPPSTDGRLAAGADPPAGTPLRGLTWGRNGAHMAGITRRIPVRVAIHGSRLRTRMPPPGGPQP